MFSPRLITIGGTGRSGTTITARAFSNHPDIAGVPESRYLIDPDGLADFYGSVLGFWSPYAIDRKLRRLERMLTLCGRDKGFFIRVLVPQLNRISMQRAAGRVMIPPYAAICFERVCPNYFDYVRELMDDLRSYVYDGQWVGMSLFEKRQVQYAPPMDRKVLAEKLGHFYRRIAADVVSSQNKTVFFEKNTFTILAFDNILEILPELKLVHVYRDPRDVVASYCQATAQPWAPSDPEQAAVWLKGGMTQWLKIRANLPPGSFIEVPFERIVEDREGAFREMCAFWELDWHESLLEIKFNRPNIARWKRSFTEEQAGRVTEIVGDIMSCYGYS